MITKTVLIITRIFVSYAVKQVSCFESDRGLMETETTKRSEFPNGGTVIVEQISVRRKKEIQKSMTVRVIVRDPSTKANHLSEVIEIKNL